MLVFHFNCYKSSSAGFFTPSVSDLGFLNGWLAVAGVGQEVQANTDIFISSVVSEVKVSHLGWLSEGSGVESLIFIMISVH